MNCHEHRCINQSKPFREINNGVLLDVSYMVELSSTDERWYSNILKKGRPRKADVRVCFQEGNFKIKTSRPYKWVS